MESNLINTENGVESSISQDKVNNSNLYLDETDSNGIPLLRRIEKYPDLPEDEFIPIEYTHLNGVEIPKDLYEINKLGEVRNVKTNVIYKPRDRKENSNYKFTMLYIPSINKSINVFFHRLVAFTFLINPDQNTYNVVNHIDHNPENNNLSNLEWVTTARNSDVSSGMRTKSSRKLTEYVAKDEKGNEVYRVTRETAKDFGFSIESLINCTSQHKVYKGYYWTAESNLENNKELFYKIIGFSGNLDDYSWEQVNGYNDLFICREGFFKTSRSNKVIGSINKDGYIKISVKKNNSEKHHAYFAHRLVVEHFMGVKLKEGEVIDHINTIKTDNSIDNLKISNSIDNMRNPITLEKRYRKIILTNLYGDFISYDHCENLCKIIYSGDNYFIGNGGGVKNLLRNTFSNKNFICIEQGDSERLFNILEKVIYVFDKEMNLVDAFSSSRDIEYFYKNHNIKYFHVIKSIKSKEIAIDGYYYRRGRDAVEKIKSLGHMTALKFNPEMSEDEINSIKGELVIRDSKLSYNPQDHSGKAVKEYDIFGNFIKEFDNKEEAIDFYKKSGLSLNKVVSGIYLMSNGSLWCNSGEEYVIKEKTNYIFYKFDKDKKLVAGNKNFGPICTNYFKELKKYLNTGIPAPDGYYYQQGDPENMLYDPDNTDLIPKREILKWEPKNKK